MDTLNDKVERLLDLVEENNRLLKKMRRDSFWKSMASIVWWLIILFGPVVLYYYYLAPYIDAILAQYQALSGTADSPGLFATSTLPSLKDIFAPITFPH